MSTYDDLADAVLSTALAQGEPRGRGVRHDVAADGLDLVGGGREGTRAVRVRHHLVRHHYRHTVLSCATPYKSIVKILMYQKGLRCLISLYQSGIDFKCPIQTVR